MGVLPVEDVAELSVGGDSGLGSQNCYMGHKGRKPSLTV